MTLPSGKKPASPFHGLTPGVVFQPRSRQRFQQGIAAIVDAIRPTLGPLPRLVAVSRTHTGDSPELLDDGGLIARRIVALTDRDADMGAMFVRHVLWRLREEVGDGTATAAVLLKTIYDEGAKHIVAGGNAMRLREALESLLPLLLDELSRQSIPLSPRERAGEAPSSGVRAESLTNFARSACPDLETADLLGEIFDVIGLDGHLEVENARGQRSKREYIEGAFWESGLASRSMVNDPRRLVARLENAAILITDLEINSAQALVPALRAVMEGGHTALAIIARKFSDDASALLVNASNSGKLTAIGIKTPGTGTADQFANLQDLVTLAGGRAILTATGDSIESLRSDDFGRARRLWADPEYFGIVGGKGDPLALRRHLSNLKSALNASDSSDSRRKLRARLGRLNGGAARLLVGGQTESEQKHRRGQAERASLVMRAALRDGILPGGGAAFLACRAALAPSGDSAQSAEQSAACRILQKALAHPAIAIATNAGYKLHDLPPGLGFNALTGQPADMLAAGILDAAGVQKAALVTAVKGAALALTVDVLIHHVSPQFSAEP